MACEKHGYTNPTYCPECDLEGLRAHADAEALKDICPCCHGTGDEDGTGDACGGDNCDYCQGHGCGGGTCSWCAGSGKFSAWRSGFPSYAGIVSDNLVPR